MLPTCQLAPHIPQWWAAQLLAPVEMRAPGSDTGLPLQPRPLETPALLLQSCQHAERNREEIASFLLLLGPKWGRLAGGAVSSILALCFMDSRFTSSLPMLPESHIPTDRGGNKGGVAARKDWGGMEKQSISLDGCGWDNGLSS